MDTKFSEAIVEFEQHIIVAGVEKGIIGRTEMVPVRMGKLASTEFGKCVGVEIQTSVPLAIDYYGYTKKSTGFFVMFNSIKAEYPEKQLKMVEAPIVHFAALRIEEIAAICSAPEVIAEFPRLKGAVLTKRGFKK